MKGVTDFECKAKSYWRHRYAASAAGLAVLMAFLLWFQLGGISHLFKGIAESLSTGYYPQLLVYLSIFGLLTYIITLPLDFYGGFILERRYSLSDQRAGRWFKDEAKKAAISAILFLASVISLYAIASLFRSIWWPVASIFWISLTVIMAQAFPVLVLPLFYKYKPLSSNDLKNKCLELAGAFDINVIDVYEIDYSKTTKKSNAAVIGLGGSRRIIMADNLIREFSEDEVVAVLAHEMAHHKMKHMWILISVSALSITAFFYLLELLAGPIASLALASDITDMAAFPPVYFTFLLYGLAAAPIHNIISRKLETDADTMALTITKRPDVFISMMERLGRRNLADFKPNGIVEFLLYSHPSISKRIALARKFQK